jgi:hypothetical protein
MTTVYEYFTTRLGRTPDDETLKDLPLDSGCGDDCKRAIDTAFEFLEVVKMGNRHHAPTVVALAEHTAEIFWRG